MPKGGPHTDSSLYRDLQLARSGPSPFFGIAGVLIRDSDRSRAVGLMRQIAAKARPSTPLKQIHWLDLKLDQRDFVAGEVAKIDFIWIMAFACKMALKQRLKPPLLYHYVTKLVLERANQEALERGNNLVPVFSYRSRTSYPQLEAYIRYAFDSSLIAPFVAEAPAQSRLLQIADVCAGAFSNALEPNRFGKVTTQFADPLVPKLRRHNGNLWSYGLKAYVGTLADCGLAEAWLRSLR